MNKVCVTFKVIPNDQRQRPSYYDFWNPTPTLLGRRLQDFARGPVEVEVVCDGGLAWVQQVVTNINNGYDYWQRVA
jgi:hypothetical protein